MAAKTPAMRLLRILFVCVVATALPVGALPVLPASTPSPVCDRLPDPARWADAGTPDKGLEHMRISVHRGAHHLAPENTIPAYEYAIAYDMDLIEVDVQQTIDGRYVAFHDLTVDDKTDGSGYLPLMTYEEATSLNAAANPRWEGSAYDPTPVPGLEEVLALARDHEVGISFDLKESVWNAAGVALLAVEYEVIERSIFQPYVPGRTEQILAVAPDATVMFNNQYDDTPPALLYALGQEYHWFGSSLPNFSPERIAAIHDACSSVLPNVYQGHVTGSEPGDLAYARSIGADGAMVNNPDVAAEVLDRPVDTTIALDPDAGTACLLGHHGLGLPGKTVHVGGEARVTGKGGCVVLGAGWDGGAVTFAGDGSAVASST